MTNAYQQARDRVSPLLKVRQVREFTSDPVPDELLRAITTVARWSGSGGNQQPWRFIVVRDRAALARVAELGAPQTRSLTSAQACIFIALPADEDRRETNIFDDGRAAERMMAAASMLGLGAAVMRIRPEPLVELRKMLNLPEDRFIRTAVALGYSTATAAQPQSKPGEARLPESATVRQERWG